MRIQIGEKQIELHPVQEGVSMGDLVTLAELYSLDWRAYEYDHLRHEIENQGETGVWEICMRVLYGADYAVHLPYGWKDGDGKLVDSVEERRRGMPVHRS
ncbi:MAG: hypothetical protein ACLQNE_47080 [Thermoguttaceae bacterium]